MRILAVHNIRSALLSGASLTLCYAYLPLRLFPQPGWGNILEASCSLSSRSQITELLLAHGADHTGSGENMVRADRRLVSSKSVAL